MKGIAGIAAGFALTAPNFAFAARFVAQRRFGWAIFSALSGAIYFVLPWTSFGLASLLVPVASVIGWAGHGRAEHPAAARNLSVDLWAGVMLSGEVVDTSC